MGIFLQIKHIIFLITTVMIENVPFIALAVAEALWPVVDWFGPNLDTSVIDTIELIHNFCPCGSDPPIRVALPSREAMATSTATEETSARSTVVSTPSRRRSTVVSPRSRRSTVVSPRSRRSTRFQSTASMGIGPDSDIEPELELEPEPEPEPSRPPEPKIKEARNVSITPTIKTTKSSRSTKFISEETDPERMSMAISAKSSYYPSADRSDTKSLTETIRSTKFATQSVGEPGSTSTTFISIGASMNGDSPPQSTKEIDQMSIKKSHTSMATSMMEPPRKLTKIIEEPKEQATRQGVSMDIQTERWKTATPKVSIVEELPKPQVVLPVLIAEPTATQTSRLSIDQKSGMVSVVETSDFRQQTDAPPPIAAETVATSIGGISAEGCVCKIPCICTCGDSIGNGSRETIGEPAPFRKERSVHPDPPKLFGDVIGLQQHSTICEAWDVFGSAECHTKLPSICKIATFENGWKQQLEDRYRPNKNQQDACGLHYDPEDFRSGSSVGSHQSDKMIPRSHVKPTQTLWAIAKVDIFEDICTTYEMRTATKDKPDNVPDSAEGIFVICGSRKCQTHIQN